MNLNKIEPGKSLEPNGRVIQFFCRWQISLNWLKWTNAIIHGIN